LSHLHVELHTLEGRMDYVFNGFGGTLCFFKFNEAIAFGQFSLKVSYKFYFLYITLDCKNFTNILFNNLLVTGKVVDLDTVVLAFSYFLAMIRLFMVLILGI